ncbi:RNase adapter RapZ [Fusibacter sp. JL298sf-3]
MNFVIISGQSGAGKSQAKKAFEDFGYYCVDNLPPSLIPNFIELIEQSSENISNIALVIDIRGGKFFSDLQRNLSDLRDRGYAFKIFYFEADDKVLIKRFKESRRSHPLDLAGRIEDAIAEEKRRLNVLKEKADYVINTSYLTHAALKKKLLKALDSDDQHLHMALTFMSFGFKKGIPLDSDFVFDVRFLPNPYYIEALRHLTGNQQEVREYVMNFDESKAFLDQIVQMLDFAIPFFTNDGRSQLVVAVGCTGGQHRSVSFANVLADHYEAQGFLTSKVHRDAKRVGGEG